MHKRKIIIVNRQDTTLLIIKNRIIIDLVQEFILQINQLSKQYNQINHVRLYKQMILPIKLLDYRERILLEAFIEQEKEIREKEILNFHKIELPNDIAK